MCFGGHFNKQNTVKDYMGEITKDELNDQIKKIL